MISCSHGNTTHGGSYTPEFMVWARMKYRILNPKSPAFKNYGGRGIGLHKSWHEFAVFIFDMGWRPSKKHQLERIDNNGDYCKENCKWATRLEQARNKRNNVFITFNGETKTRREWANQLSIEFGISFSTIDARMIKGLAFDQVTFKGRLSKYNQP